MSVDNTIRTIGIILRRTNYGESDRILNILTPEGKISVIAKSVRKAKSKLAGGVEMFCLSEIVAHKGRGEMYTLTGAKMTRFYQNIITDFSRLEVASSILKKLSRVAGDVDSVEYFELLKQTLEGIDDGYDLNMTKLWFELNFARIGGEEYNLYFDSSGQKLQPDEKYCWDRIENILTKNPHGKISTDEIKLARLMMSSKLALIARVKNAGQIALNILQNL